MPPAAGLAPRSARDRRQQPLRETHLHDRSLHGAMRNRSSMPGTANAVQTMK
jgi:hypothetical protein